MATKNRAAVVTLDGLQASIDKAVALAEKRHGAVFEAGTVSINWEIFGRKIKSLKTGPDNSRFDVATTITGALKLPTGPSPIVIGNGKWILVGYWDPPINRGPINL